ncbi:MAG: SpoIVB peptidase S55 domain-containing protein [Bacillota bacterium]|nr:SpoIVB peptidase S55 domain-containing protein [Bacillota bacterium]
MVRKCCVLAGIFLCLYSAMAIRAAEVYPLEAVYPGLRGIGKTVVQGTLIEEFDVEVISIIPQPASIPDLIMVRVSGDTIDRSGGIASGMSGSPVYVDGKLLGAISYAYEYSDHRVGLLTPAVPMLELMEIIPTLDIELPNGFREIATPLAVSGIGGRALAPLTKAFAPYNVQVIPDVSGIIQQMDFARLEPGSAFAVQLLRGDFQVAAFGTITEVDENGRFVGFGHSFLHKGNVNYFAAPAVIHYTMPNLEVPYKIASAGSSVGAIYQDRAAGVAGLLDAKASYIPINISVTDLEHQRQDTYRVESIADRSLLPALVISSAYQGIDSSLDRIGPGTAYIRLEFHAHNLPQPIIRENMFYSDSDIAVWSLSDLSEGLEVLMGNNLQPIDLKEVSVSIDVENSRRTAEIEKAIPRKFQVEAGGSVEVEVRIRPFHNVVETRVLRIDIPEDTLPGLMTVSVRGGSSGYYYAKPTVHTTWESLQEQDVDVMWREPTQAESLDLLLNGYMNRERNNEIVAEFYPYIDLSSEFNGDGYYDSTEFGDEETVPISEVVMLEKDFGIPQWESNNNEPVRVRLTTQYVIEGSASFDIEVL